MSHAADEPCNSRIIKYVISGATILTKYQMVVNPCKTMNERELKHSIDKFQAL
jgi:hypothetical protein